VLTCLGCKERILSEPFRGHSRTLAQARSSAARRTRPSAKVPWQLGRELMEPRLNVITLAVEDLERALKFYRDGLGFQSPGVIGSEWTDERTGANGAVALFELEGGLLLSLYPQRPRQGRRDSRPGCAERRVQPRPARPEPHRCRR